jgi:pilus assembly protein Flp/PilA
MTSVSEFFESEVGASAAEYALILAIIAASIVAALVALQGSIIGAVGNASSEINSSAS